MTRRALVIVIFRGLLIDSIDRLYWSIGLLFSAGGILYNVVLSAFQILGLLLFYPVITPAKHIIYMPLYSQIPALFLT